MLRDRFDRFNRNEEDRYDLFGFEVVTQAAPTLVVQNASHSHSADSPTLTQVHSLALQNASHLHSADGVALTQTHSLALQSSSHSHSAQNVVLITVEQEGFRWHNDDGDESSATWAAGQDTNYSVSIGVPVRLRVLINGSGNPDPAQFRLEYRAAGSADPWEVVS